MFEQQIGCVKTNKQSFTRVSAKTWFDQIDQYIKGPAVLILSPFQILGLTVTFSSMTEDESDLFTSDGALLQPDHIHLKIRE